LVDTAGQRPALPRRVSRTARASRCAIGNCSG